MSVLMAVVATLAAVNPPRRVVELDPRPRPVVAGAGAALVLSVVVVVAWTSDPVLDALDVSDATWRVAAGLVLAARGLLDLVLAPRPEPEGWTGWAEAVVPVAFPVLLRPEVVAIGLAAGTDQGVAVAALAAALALGLTVGTTIWLTSRRAARALGALVSAGAVALGISLVIAGVLDL